MKEIPKTFFAKTLQEYNMMQGIQTKTTIKKDELRERLEKIESRITKIETTLKTKDENNARN